MEILVNGMDTMDWEMNSTFTYEYEYDYIDEDPDCVYEGHINHFLVSLYSLLLMVGFIGNALVLWVITVGTQLKTMTDVGLLNLALADLLLVLSLLLKIYNMFYSWIFGRALCALVFGVHFFGFYGGIFFIVMMSIDRYLVVVHSVFALRVRTKAYGILASLVIWILAVAAFFPDLLYIKIKRMGNEDYEYCTIDYEPRMVTVRILKMSVVGLLVAVIMGFCYSMILWRLHRSPSPKKHSIRLIVLAMIIFFCCWMPYNIVLFLEGLRVMSQKRLDCKFIDRRGMAELITEAVPYFTSCLNPLIYMLVGQNVRRHFVRILRERLSVCCS